MGLNVLIVDDSDVIRAMITRTLRLADVPVTGLYEAANGREALDVLDDSWIDLVLADMNMPVMGGGEMLERMRSKPETADVPVIVVSTEGATERVNELMERGVAAWVRKPFTPEEISKVISDVTSSWPTDVEHHAMLDSVFGPLLETFAFVYPEPCERDSAPLPGEDLVSASVSFHGASTGALGICAPADLCVELAANILGIDADDTDARLKGADTLGEIANIATGHIATALVHDAPTDLSAPVVCRVALDEWERLAETPGTRVYLVEGHPVLVTLGVRPRHTC